MRLSAALPALLFLLAGACAPDAPPPTGPTYLGGSPEVWAKAITDPDLREREAALNRLALGREDVIPVLTALLGHEDPEVAAGAYLALCANLDRVERKGPWIPALEAAAGSADPDLRQAAAERLTALRGK